MRTALFIIIIISMCVAFYLGYGLGTIKGYSRGAEFKEQEIAYALKQGIKDGYNFNALGIRFYPRNNLKKPEAKVRVKNERD